MDGRQALEGNGINPYEGLDDRDVFERRKLPGVEREPGEFELDDDEFE